MSLYGWIILISLGGPLILSFDKKVAFYKSFNPLLIAIILVGIPFLLWDAYFTNLEVWGFTPAYLSGIYLGNLPLEECLFFLVVPFACVFIHEVLKAYFPQYEGKRLAHIFAFTFTFSGFLFGIANLDNAYTSSACILSSLLTIGLYFVNRSTWYPQFALTYLVALIPFLIVNGILTGAFTEEPVVWYSEQHIMGQRIITIPVEDLFYNYSLLLPVIAIFEKLRQRSLIKH